MKISIFLSLVIFSIFLTSVDAGPLKRLLGLEYTYVETIKLAIPSQEDGNQYASERGESIVEWLSKEQNFNNRSELITI